MAVGDPATLLSLADEISAQISQRPDSEINVPFGRDDVGSELIAILSEGLYGDPRDALREYIQNSADAGSRDVWVEFEGRTVRVRDHGTGMELAGLLRARMVASSPKLGGPGVGFRGIGLYAGLNVCDRLVIETQSAHNDVQYVMSLDFLKMRQILAEHRIGKSSNQSSLADMLTATTSIKEREVDALAHGRTVVSLENVSPAAFRDIQDLPELERFLINSLPVAYDPNFAYAKAIDDHLSSLVPGYRTINLHIVDSLRSIEDRQIFRRFPAGIGRPRFINALAGDRFEAVIWACPSVDNESIDDGGFVYKLHGFTVGDKNRLRTLYLKRQMTYKWYFGEVHVVDDEVRPNSARNDFEYNEARARLEESVKAAFLELAETAERGSIFDRATKEFSEMEPLVADLRSQIVADKKGILVPQHFAAIQQLRTRMKKQRLQKNQHFDELRVTAERIRKSLDDLEASLPLAQPEGASPKSAMPERVRQPTMGSAEALRAEGHRIPPSKQRLLEDVDQAIDVVFAPTAEQKRHFYQALAAKWT